MVPPPLIFRNALIHTSTMEWLSQMHLLILTSRRQQRQRRGQTKPIPTDCERLQPSYRLATFLTTKSVCSTSSSTRSSTSKFPGHSKLKQLTITLQRRHLPRYRSGYSRRQLSCPTGNGVIMKGGGDNLGPPSWPWK